jgi:pentatricopeptide repeat protein
MTASQIHTPINKIKTTTANNITIFRNQNMYYSTLNPNTTSPKDLIHPYGFLHEGLDGKISTYSLFVPVLDRLTRFKSVENLISDLQSVGLFNDDSSTNLLSLLAYAGKKEMVKSHGFVPNTFALNLYVGCLFGTSQNLHAFSVLEQINSPDFSTFKITLYHLTRLNDITNISFYLRLMLSVPYYPDNVTFNKVLISFCKINDDEVKIDVMAQVYQLLGLAVKLGVEISANGWTSIIHKCCELGRLHDATKLFSYMIQTPCSLDVVPVTHTVLFKAFLDSNKVDDALYLFIDMLTEGFTPDKDYFAKLVTALFADGRMDDAVCAYGNIAVMYPHSDVHLDSHIPLMIITELINAGMNDKAEIVLTLSRNLRTEACLPSEGNM